MCISTLLAEQLFGFAVVVLSKVNASLFGTIDVEGGGKLRQLAARNCDTGSISDPLSNIFVITKLIILTVFVRLATELLFPASGLGASGSRGSGTHALDRRTVSENTGLRQPLNGAAFSPTGPHDQPQAHPSKLSSSRTAVC
jgi:hypothetical protein